MRKRNVFLKQISSLKTVKLSWEKTISLESRPVEVCLHCFLGSSKSGIIMDVLLVPEIEPKAESFLGSASVLHRSVTRIVSFCAHVVSAGGLLF